MENVSNKVLGLLNILTFLISIPIVFLGVQLHRVNGLATCFDLLRLPILVLGVLIMVMSIVGIIGACCGITWLLWTYNLVMSILIFSLIAVFMFALFVTWRSGGGTRIPGTEIKEYKLSEYTDWLQDRVKGKGWDKIHNCLVVANTCSLMPENDTTLQDFNTKELNPVMSGCCKPLAECGFGYQSPSMWKKPNKMSSSNADCKAWNNDPKAKCYDCDSCKAGVLQQAVATWRKTHFAKVILMVFLMILNNVGMCALKNARKKTDF